MEDQDRPIQNFPDTYSIKAVGKDTGDFEQFALSIVRAIVEHTDSITHYSRASRTGAYLSVTISFTARDQIELDRVFSEVSEHERVVWVL